MIKATNPATRQSEIVTPQEAEDMRNGIACREYQFEALEEPEPIEPPAVEMPENAPKRLSEADVPAMLDGTLEGTFETALGKMQFTKPAKRG